jgi:hypothetical protein
MKKLTSKAIIFHKWIFPFIWFGFLGVSTEGYHKYPLQNSFGGRAQLLAPDKRDLENIFAKSRYNIMKIKSAKMKLKRMKQIYEPK